MLSPPWPGVGQPCRHPDERFARLLQCPARSDAPEHLEIARLPWLAGGERRQRHPGHFLERELDPGRQHTNDHVGLPVDEERAADDLRIGVVPPPPELVAEDHD